MKKISQIVVLLSLSLSPTAFSAGQAILEYPAIDDSRQEWCYLAKTVTQVGLPCVPDCVQVTWDGAVFTKKNELCFFYGTNSTPVLQRQKTFLEGWIPVVQYGWNDGAIRYQAEIFNFNLDGRDVENTVTFVRVSATNTGTVPSTSVFTAAIRGSGGDYRYDGSPDNNPKSGYVINDHALFENDKLIYTFSPCEAVEAVSGVPYAKPFLAADYQISPRVEVGLAQYNLALKPGETRVMEFKMPRVPVADAAYNAEVAKADVAAYYRKTVDYWQKLMGDKWVIDVPEKRIQNAFRGAAVHAILGTRHKNGEQLQSDGLPYSTFYLSNCYDYEFLYDSLGLTDLVRKTLCSQLPSRQSEEGMFADPPKRKIMQSHGQALMMVLRHILITQDKAYGAEVYPMIKKGVDFIAKEHQTDTYGLMRPSHPYDNEMIYGRYTSHNLWSLAALRRAICVARLLGKTEDEKSWLELLEPYRKAVLKALDASVNKDGYVPTGLYEFTAGKPGKPGYVGYGYDQDWENCLLAYPSEVLDPADPRVVGTNKRLRATKYAEGIMTYRNGMHLHQYVTCNPAMQDLVGGRSREALMDIYHILLHEGSTFEGFENQVEPWTDRIVHGFPPPHAWGASKIAGFIRNMFVMEYGGDLGLEPEKRDLYLFSVVSPAWVKPGQTISVRNALTEFGTISASMRFGDSGAEVKLKKQFRAQPGHLVVRIPYFVKDVSFKTDAKSSERKGNAVYLSSDATSLSFAWTLDPDTDRNTYQDILMTYRQEQGFWPGQRPEMPATRPAGFLAEDETTHPAEPLSFKLVTEAYSHEYARRYNAGLKDGKSPLPRLIAPPMITDEKERKALHEASQVERSLSTGGYNSTVSQNRSLRRFATDGKRGNTHEYWEADPAWSPAWINIDLGKIVDVSRVIVVPYYGEPRQAFCYILEGSADGKTWTLLQDQSENKVLASKEGYSYEFLPAKMRYIKVTAVKNAANPKFKLVEVMAY